MQLDNNLFLRMTSQERAETELDIFLLAGQANAAGAAKIDGTDDSVRDRNTYENIRYCVRRALGTGVFEELDESCGPVREGLGFEPGYIGPELGMAEILNEKFAAPNKKALIIKGAARGVAMGFANCKDAEFVPTKGALERFLERGSWYPFEDEGTDPFRPTGLLVRNFLSFIEKMYGELAALGFKKIRFSAFVWMQGEDDRKEERRLAYPRYFAELLRRLRGTLEKLTGDDYSDLPVIMGEVCETFGTPAKAELSRAFVATQHEMAKANPNIHVVPTTGFPMTRLDGDQLVILGSTEWHWNYKDMLSVGRLFGEACAKYGKL